MPQEEIATAGLCYHSTLIQKSLAGRSDPFQTRLPSGIQFYQKSILRSKKLFHKLFGSIFLRHPIQAFDDAIA